MFFDCKKLNNFSLTFQGYSQPPPNYFKPQYDYSGEEEYWAKRIDTLKRTHSSLNKKMEQEYDKAVAETGQMFKRAQSSTVIGKLPPCQEQKNLVTILFLQCNRAIETNR